MSVGPNADAVLSRGCGNAGKAGNLPPIGRSRSGLGKKTWNASLPYSRTKKAYGTPESSSLRRKATSEI